VLPGEKKGGLMRIFMSIFNCNDVILYWNYTDWCQPKRVINPEPWGSEAQPNSTDKEVLCNHLVESSNITDEREGDFFVRNCMVSHVNVVLRGVLYLKLLREYLYLLVSLLFLRWIKEEITCKEDSVCYMRHCVWLFSYAILLTLNIM